MATEEGSEQLDVHTMWKHESLNFTPWLAKNLHLLGDALGMKLELVQTEALIGSLYLDILAQQTDTGVMVAIENQLEETDLSHLGQVLAYAAGCDARVTIWVAPYFRHEYAQALHWLNEWTRDEISFYGVKVEVLRRADGAPLEPRFRKVVYPGGWNKEITLPSGEMPPDKRKYYDFFQPLIATLRGADSAFADAPKQRFDYRDRLFPSRVDPSIGYSASFWKNYAWVSLHIETDDKDLTKALFDELQADREQIESDIKALSGQEWVWERHSRHSFCTINIRKDGSIDDLPEKLEKTMSWMLDLLPKLKEVFDPRLDEILKRSASEG